MNAELTRREFLALLGATSVAVDALSAAKFPGWAMGPFVKLPKPVLSPTPDSRFRCPVLGKEVSFESQNVFNAAAIVRKGKVYILYRSDGESWWDWHGRKMPTCRIGMAFSSDGRHFTRYGKPVVYPDDDDFKQYEWPGGCEDLHIVEDETGTYYMNYTTWTGERDSMCIATSKDLVHWTKHGPAFRKYAPDKIWGSRSGVVISRQVGDRLIATRIGGLYWMYYTHPCWLASSENLIDWKPSVRRVFTEFRRGYFDSASNEAGAIALLRDDGILIMFNAQNQTPERGGTPEFLGWTQGQALLDRNDLMRIIARLDKPFLYAEFDWEKRGYTNDAIVANGMAPFRGEWLLYYGASDRHIGLAVYRPHTE
jgi:predicted GH43/DUF377 family glycosyl hydrolase